MSDFNYTLKRPLPAIDIAGDFMTAFGPELQRAARELAGRPPQPIVQNKIAQVIPLRRRAVPVQLSTDEVRSCFPITCLKPSSGD